MEKVYNSEEEFLRDYDSSIFEKPSITTDLLIFSVSDGTTDNYRKLKEKFFSVLLVKRNSYPYKDKWCLPGGFLNISEETDECANRILTEETNLKNIYMEQLYTFSDINRDPRTRVVSVAYMALVDKNQLNEQLNPNASWFNVRVLEDNNIIHLTLDNGTDVIKVKVKKELKEKTTGRYTYKILENNSLAFDHANVIITGIERLKNKVEYTDIVFNMMPEYFSLGELQQVYEIILNKKLLDPAFRRIISDKVTKTTKLRKGEGHRPSYLFKYKI